MKSKRKPPGLFAWLECLSYNCSQLFPKAFRPAKRLNSQVHKIILLSLFLSACLSSHASVLQWITEPTETLPPIVNHESSQPKVSTNGRYITFLSEATNLVANDTNGVKDLFIHDAFTGITQRISTTSNDTELNDRTLYFSAPTADGQWVAFASTDSMLTQQDTAGKAWVFLKNLNTGAVTNISSYGVDQHFGVTWDMFLSDNAQQLTFISTSNIDTLYNGQAQLYQKNLNTNNIELLSLSFDGTAAADDDVLILDVSSNGRYLVVTSEATNLTNDIINNNLQNLFLYDTTLQTTQLINTTPTGQSSADSSFIESAGVSNFGEVVFVSNHDDLVNGDNNSQRDVFFFQNNSLQRINLTAGGQELTGGFAFFADINDAGTRIVFTERSGEVSNNDLNNNIDVFLHNVSTGTNTLLTVNKLGFAANGPSNSPKISGNGNRVVFTASADDLTEQPINYTESGIYLTDLNSGLIKKVTVPAFMPNTVTSNIIDQLISQDQSQMIFSTQSAGFDASGGDDALTDLYLLDRNTNQHQMLFSKATAEDLSPNGQFLVFTSQYSQPDGLTELPATSVYLFNRNDQSLTLIDEGVDARVNDDGFVVFLSFKNISAQDQNSAYDAYIYNPNNASIYLLSHGLDGLAASASGIDIAGTGTDMAVVFASSGGDLVVGDTNNQDIYLRQWPQGEIIKVSQSATGIDGDGASSYPQLSDDAQFVVYNTRAQNLTNDDYSNAGSYQVIFHDRWQQTNHLASKNDAGLPIESTNFIYRPSITRTGRYIAYAYLDLDNSNDFAGDDDRAYDVIMFDTVTQISRVISDSTQHPQIPVRSVVDFEHVRITEDLSNPPLIGVVFTASYATELTGIDNHPGHREGFLYQQGGPDLTLTVNVDGPGSITGTAGINCPGNCQGQFPLGSEVNVIATPTAGAVFTGWTTTFTECDDQQTLCTTVINRDQSITAHFFDSNDVIFNNGFEATP